MACRLGAERSLVQIQSPPRIADGDTFALLQGPFRPDEQVVLVIDVTAGNQGRLVINPNGQASLAVEQGGPATAHKLFSSLDGVSYEAGR